MEPGIIQWAENDLYAGGPDVGTATKIPPTAGQVAEGYYRTFRPAAQVWNFERWALGRGLNAVASMRVANLEPEDVSNIVGPALASTPYGCAHSGLSGPDRPMSVVVARGVALVPECYYNRVGERLWRLWGALPGGGATTPQGVASDAAGGIAQVTSVPNDAVFLSGAPGAPWIAWPFAAPPGFAWQRIACNQDPGGALWIISAGAANQIAYAVGLGTPWTIAATPPGFAGLTQFLVSSRHLAGDIYPDDPGNDVCMALTTTEVSTSVDGNIWTAAALHGFTNIPRCLAYSKHGTRWIIIESSAVGRIATSDDNGATWTESLAIDTALNLAAGGAWAEIASDGFGHWLALLCDGVTTELHASVDNGVTWAGIYLPQTAASGLLVAAGSLWFGNGVFHLFTTDNGGVVYTAISLRALS